MVEQSTTFLQLLVLSFNMSREQLTLVDWWLCMGQFPYPCYGFTTVRAFWLECQRFATLDRLASSIVSIEGIDKMQL